jgi:glutamate synthase (NADPH) small chain
MGKPTGFLEQGRELPEKEAPQERVKNWKELYKEFPNEKLQKQASRCMNCGVPFCHSGCPLGNIIPEFNDLVYNGEWAEAYEILASTNNFPEFTGRICPAPCESACVLGINQPPVTIENIEKAIVEYAYSHNLVTPRIPEERTDKKVAVVGSGPAGLAAAAQLNKAGHTVTVFERDDALGGLLRFGIPDFKLEKWVVERRVQVMEQEGVTFRTKCNVGVDVTTEELMQQFDAVVLAGGSTIARDLNAKGREADGIHFAMHFLHQQNARNSNKNLKFAEILATGKDVVVIGGGDTGSDCVGTSNRQGANSVTQIEIMPKPPEQRTASMPWPNYPMIYKVTTSHEEGCERIFAVSTKEFLKDDQGKLRAILLVDVKWEKGSDGRMNLVEVAGSEREIPCQLALLAMGFLHPQHEGLLDSLHVDYDERGNVKADTNQYQTSVPKVFAAGDMRRGQSLVVWAISEGRECARSVDAWLRGGSSVLEAKDTSFATLS